MTPRECSLISVAGEVVMFSRHQFPSSLEKVWSIFPEDGCTTYKKSLSLMKKLSSKQLDLERIEKKAKKLRESKKEHESLCGATLLWSCTMWGKRRVQKTKI
jgi:hypothetical protein